MIAERQVPPLPERALSARRATDTHSGAGSPAPDPRPPGAGDVQVAGAKRHPGWLVAGAITGALGLGGCTLPAFGQSSGITKQAGSELHLWQGFMVAGIVVGLIVFGLIMWSIVRFRRKGDTMPRQTSQHIPMEIAYTIIPILIVIVLFIATVITENKVDALKPPNVAVKVTAFQWGWRFDYQGKNVTVTSQNVLLDNQATYPVFVVPEDETVGITLVSLDVVHGFYVRQLEFSRYALPGFTNHFDFNFTRTGSFIGQCTQFCGLHHDLMLFTLKVVSPEQFNSWISTQQAAQRSAGGSSALSASPSNLSGSSNVSKSSRHQASLTAAIGSTRSKEPKSIQPSLPGLTASSAGPSNSTRGAGA